MYKAVVIGTSSGGPETLRDILPKLPEDFPLAILVVLHIGDNSNDSFIQLLNRICKIKVKEADDKEKILPGTVYFAPPNYHLMVEEDATISLSTDPKVHHSRPSIDVLFETASWTFKEQLIGVILSGLNEDGAEGLREIKSHGGTIIVEHPDSSSASLMPQAALKRANPHFSLQSSDIATKIIELAKQGEKGVRENHFN